MTCHTAGLFIWWVLWGIWAAAEQPVLIWKRQHTNIWGLRHPSSLSFWSQQHTCVRCLHPQLWWIWGIQQWGFWRSITCKQAQPQAQQQQPPQQQQQLTLFGQPQQQQQQYHPQQVHPHQQQAVVAYGNELSSGVAPATQEVLGLMHSWTPGAPQYQRFVGLLLQALPPGYELEQVPKPPEIDSLQWRDAKEQCMRLSHLERLMPVPVLGFQGLLQRKEAQDLALKEQQERLQNAAGIAETLKRQHKVVAQEGLARIKQQHQDLAFRLIKVQRHVDALLGHVAVELGQKDPREGAVVEQLGAMLGQAESILGPGEAAGLARRVGALAAAASLRAGAGSAQPRLNRIEQHSLEEMKVSIREQVQAIQKLQDIMTAQGRDLAVLQEQLALRRRP
eukprot:jgi/Astpho2/2361/fgenesh1_pg.00044_%23_19_t